MLPGGEVKICAHCEGKGVCKRKDDYNSCNACVIKAGADLKDSHRGIVCSACGGKGSVWIGPDVVQIVERKQ